MHASRLGQLGILMLMALGAERLFAQTCDPEDIAGELILVEGNVDIQSAGGGTRRATLADAICLGDTLIVGAPGSAEVRGSDGWQERFDQNSAMRFGEVDEDDGSFLDLLHGVVFFFSRNSHDLEVVTPFLNAAVEGTEFVVRVGDDEAEIIVLEGHVAATNESGQVSLAVGRSAVAQRGSAPELRTLVSPRDAVQWSIFYPPILSGAEIDSARDSGDWPEEVIAVAQFLATRDYIAAFDALDGVAESGRNAPFFTMRAALSLAFGQADAARADIERALGDDPGAGLAYALRAVIAVAQNELNQALADGSRALELEPRSAAARIALSYAQQADLDLPAARDTLQRAVTDQPEHALAWARLAEIWLALGFRDRAREAAATAVRLDPNEPRTRIVLGFAALSELRSEEAIEIFMQAIELRSADPLPRLGLGLALIHQGELESGRQEIENAIGLDPNSALLRAYLGKAYFEERRAPLDAEQLATARALDPNDPTAFLYDGIRLQTENRPVEALESLRQSIDRNDNRAVYRSRLQLDADRAARGTSLARAYLDLGFEREAIGAAYAGLTDDPGNASAHRFVADAYRGTRRRESARVSELLQAQLLQDINIHPIQPSISETNLNIGASGGPSQTGMNELTPLFERNQISFNASLFGGNRSAGGGEALVSAVHDRYSFSAGAFRFVSNGFRPNNRIEHEIFDLFGQVAISPKINVQAELRRRDSAFGDLELNFDPMAFDPDETRELDQDMARIGLRISPTPGSEWIVSLIGNDRDELVDGPVLDVLALDRGYQADLQHIRRGDRYKITAGISNADVDRELLFSANDFLTTLRSESRITHPRAYGYVNFSFGTNVIWTIGISHDDYTEDSLKVDELSPKLGLLWDISSRLRLRAAWFRTVKPALVSNRTIEPTQVAGFTQLFDDVNASASEVRGIALDWRTTSTLHFGAETTQREIDVPVFINASHRLQFENEELHRLYMSWTPTSRLAFTAEAVYDEFDGGEGVLTNFGSIPQSVVTKRVPLALKYFHPSGFYAGIGTDFVRQSVSRSGLLAPPGGSDEFTLVDLTAGYRLPNRRGAVSLAVQNLRDTEFRYQDDSFREFGDEPAMGPYIPDRTVLLRASVNF